MVLLIKQWKSSTEHVMLSLIQIGIIFLRKKSKIVYVSLMFMLYYLQAIRLSLTITPISKLA